MAKTPAEIGFLRWPSKLTSSTIFDSTKNPHFTDPIQGELGTCYFIAGMAATAGHTSKLINDVLLTKDKNSAGIHAARFFIRGKPWVVDIDDRMLFKLDPTDKWVGPDTLYFGQQSKKGLMWGPIIEKAWGKVKGNMLGAAGGI
jgi:hypothetical protein